MIAGASAGVACSLVFPYDGYGPGTAEADAGDAGRLDAADAFTPGCPLVHAPARPSADDPGGTDTSITLALNALVFGVGTIQTPGLDLDGLCTCPDVPACVAPQTTCDREGGVDNAFDEVLARFGSFGAPVKQAKVQDSLNDGDTSVLLVIHRYNGLPNDTSVELGMMASLGTPPATDGGKPVPPRHDGTDVWTVDPASVANDSEPFLPKAIATEAYVAGGVLVAHGTFTITLGNASPLAITLLEGIITARLSHDGIWRMSGGRLAGRWPMSKLLTSLAAIPDPASGSGFLCGDSGTYQTYKPQLCSAVDILAASANDRTDKKCDSVSVGMGFEAVESKSGALAPARNLSAGCGRDWQDDCPR